MWLRSPKISIVTWLQPALDHLPRGRDYPFKGNSGPFRKVAVVEDHQPLAWRYCVKVTKPEMAIVLHVADDGFDGGPTP